MPFEIKKFNRNSPYCYKVYSTTATGRNRYYSHDYLTSDQALRQLRAIYANYAKDDKLPKKVTPKKPKKKMVK
jgi:hypothetical protein